MAVEPVPISSSKPPENAQNAYPDSSKMQVVEGGFWYGMNRARNMPQFRKLDHLLREDFEVRVRQWQKMLGAHQVRQQAKQKKAASCPITRDRDQEKNNGSEQDRLEQGYQTGRIRKWGHLLCKDFEVRVRQWQKMLGTHRVRQQVKQKKAASCPTTRDRAP